MAKKNLFKQSKEIKTQARKSDMSEKPLDVQLDLFPIPTGDVRLQDQQELMMFQFFSLSKGRRTQSIEYKNDKGDFIKVSGHQDYGMATIWDYDILLYAASQLIHARQSGETPSRYIEIVPYDLLKFTRRPTGGVNYERLWDALKRLQTTVVSTSIRNEKTTRKKGFTWITDLDVETSNKTDKIIKIKFVLCDWFYEGIMNDKQILRITPEYFTLKGGFERWLYRLVRKHGGKQKNGFSISLKTLYDRSGSKMAYKDFKKRIIDVINKGNIPEYIMALVQEEGKKYPTLYFYHQESNQPERFHQLVSTLGNKVIATGFPGFNSKSP